MPTGVYERKRPTSADQLARLGHIAAAISGAMKAKGITVADLGRALNSKAANPYGTVKYWLDCKGAPNGEMRKKLSKILGLPETALTALRGDATQREAAAVHALVPALGASLGPVKARTPDVLTFTVEAGGMARLRLDVSLPVAAAVPLLRMILDAGLVLSVEG
jgi:hypothetical protein